LFKSSRLSQLINSFQHGELSRENIFLYCKRERERERERACSLLISSYLIRLLGIDMATAAVVV
jgi:hypothetical protein